MEKILSPDERIKRAEEIYYRRKMQNASFRTARVNVSEKKDFGMFKKMILQIAICIVVYAIFYMIQNTNYIFSENVINKTNEILSYDINLQKLYQQGKQYMNNLINDISKDFEPTKEDEKLAEENVDSEDSDLNTSNEEEQGNNDAEETNEEQNIGGENVDKQEEPLSQMEQDAKYILEKKSLIIPLKGTITSRFGLRNPETETVPKNHTGIDIAANQGTVFIAAMSGIVQELSSIRRFRKSCKNCKWRCSNCLCTLQNNIC